MTLRSRWRAARSALGLGRESEAVLPELPGVVGSVAIIMDGNARWARERRLPVAAGHRAGAQALKEIVRHAPDVGIRDLTVFSFSTENWSRPENEVEGLMTLFTELIERELPELHDEEVQLRFIGRIEMLPEPLRERIALAEAETAHHGRLRLFVAMNYGGRQEIVDAARRFGAECGPDADEAEFARYLYGPDLRDPELVIRTAGEQRLSNFLLWQSAYSELVFTDVLWPDFGIEDLQTAVQQFASRRRRFGARG